MKVKRVASALTMAAVMAAATGVLRADVRADEKTRVEFSGMLGRMVNLFGGKAAREGIQSTVAVKADRKATMNDTTGQIIDLNEEKVYDLDIKRKTYKVTTFAELRRRMEEAQKKAADDAKKEPAGEQPAPPPDQKQLEVDFEVKNTGQRKTINGLETSQSLITITVREKGKTLEESGGFVLTVDTWLTPKIAAMDEILAFDRRYAEKLYGPMIAGVSAEQTAAALALYPQMASAMEKLRTEGSKLEGTPILTTTTFESVKSATQFAAEQKQRAEADKGAASPSGGLGGMVGGLARRAAQRKVEGEPRPRATVMSATTEVLKVVPSATDADVAMRTGFKENK